MTLVMMAFFGKWSSSLRFGVYSYTALHVTCAERSVVALASERHGFVQENTEESN
jgi:hypothetical protein